jgi:hypothetical protein
MGGVGSDHAIVPLQIHSVKMQVCRSGPNSILKPVFERMLIFAKGTRPQPPRKQQDREIGMDSAGEQPEIGASPEGAYRSWG